MDGMKRKVVCAAVIYPSRPDVMLVGPRHFDMIMRNQYKKLFAMGEALGEDESVEGFLDQYGDFLTREEAYVVAKEASQIIRRCGGDDKKLFSENLY